MRGILTLTGIIFFLPFVSPSGFYFPFITPRNFIFRICVEAMILLFIVLVVQNPKYILPKNKILLIFAGFVASFTLSSILAGDFLYSFWSSFERMDGLITLYHQFAFFFILLGVLQTKKEWEMMMQVSIFSAIAIAFVGLSQVAGVNLLLESSGGERVSSTLGNPTYLSAYLLIHIFMCLYFFMKNKEIYDVAIFKYCFIGFDIFILFLEIKYGLGSGKSGILRQLFSNAILWIPFVIFHILAFLPFWKGALEKINKFLPYIFYGLVIVMFSALITFTQTRGAIIGIALAIAFAFVAVLLRRGVKMNIKIYSVCIVLALSLGSILVFNNKNNLIVAYSPFLSRIASISLSDHTTQTRLATWNAALRGFYDKPIFGWGMENFYQVFDKYFPTVIYDKEDAVVWFDRPHNIIIQYASEGGAVGLALYLGFIGFLIYYLLRYQKKNYIGIIFSSFLIAYIGQNLFVFDSLNSSMPFYFMIGFISHLVLRESEKPAQPHIEEKQIPFVIKNNKEIVYIASFLIMAFIIWYCNIVPMSQNANFLKTFAMVNKNFSENEAKDLLDTIEKGPYLGRFELIYVAADWIKNMIKDNNKPSFILSELFSRSEKQMLDSIEKHQGDVRLKIFLMNFYMDTMGIEEENAKKIIAMREKTIEQSPTRAYTFLLTGRAYMSLGEYEKGVADFEKASDLAPRVFDPHWALFSGYVTIKNIDKAQEQLKILKELRTLASDNYKRIAGVYAARGYYKEAEELLLEGITHFPNATILYSSMADVYAKDGKIVEARKAAEKAVEIDPSFKGEADAFIKELESTVPAKKK